MARPPDGTTAAPLSRTAILGTVAARAALRADTQRGEFFKDNDIRVSARDANRALEIRRRPAGEKALHSPDQRDWLWDSFEVDTAKLNLELVVAWLPRPPGPGPRPNQADLLRELRRTPGVLRLYDCFDDTVIIVAVSVGPISSRDLQARLRELCPEVLWAQVRDVERDQPARGWLGTARRVAADERRLQTA